MYQPTEKFGISAGLDFRYAQSKEVTYKALSLEYTAQAKMSTFEIPVLAHYNFSQHFSVFAGPKFNFVEEFKMGQFLGYEGDASKSCQSTVSIPVGFTYTFNKPWVLSAYYDIPTGDFTKKDSGYKSKQSNIFVTIGYKFNM